MTHEAHVIADQELDRERALARQHAAEDDRELARRDEAEERGRLGHRHEGDQQVGPLAEAAGDVLDQALDHADAEFGRRPRREIGVYARPLNVVNIRLP